MNTFYPILFALMALFFLGIGVHVIAKNRPLFLSSKYFFAFMVLTFSPQFVNSYNFFSLETTANLQFIMLLNPIMFICLLVFFWFQMKGYMAIGVNDESFRDALHFSLAKNNLPFEEQLSTIKLTSLNTSLQIAIQSWIGVGQYKLKKSKDSQVLMKITEGLNEYYINNSVNANKITSIFYIVIGIFMLISAVAFSKVFS
jgi:hypothetical protein